MTWIHSYLHCNWVEQLWLLLFFNWMIISHATTFLKVFLFKGTSHRNTKWHVWNQSFFFAFWKFTRDGSSLRWHFWKSCTPTSVALLKTIRFFYRKVKGSNLEPGKNFFFIFQIIIFNFSTKFWATPIIRIFWCD